MSTYTKKALKEITGQNVKIEASRGGVYTGKLLWHSRKQKPGSVDVFCIEGFGSVSIDQGEFVVTLLD